MRVILGTALACAAALGLLVFFYFIWSSSDNQTHPKRSVPYQRLGGVGYTDIYRVTLDGRDYYMLQRYQGGVFLYPVPTQ